MITYCVCSNFIGDEFWFHVVKVYCQFLMLCDMFDW